MPNECLCVYILTKKYFSISFLKLILPMCGMAPVCLLSLPTTNQSSGYQKWLPLTPCQLCLSTTSATVSIQTVQIETAKWWQVKQQTLNKEN